MKTYQRPMVASLLRMLREGPAVLQVLIGPRQVGKTTAALQVAGALAWPSLVVSADSSPPPGPEWVETHWHRARVLAQDCKSPVLLVLDEVQKVRDWREVTKRLWDEELAKGSRLRVLLLGSSALLMQKGLNESLAGRFFLHRCGHWSYPECQDAFGWNLNQWLYYGGYPGAAQWISNTLEWKQYVSDSLIETVLARDVLQLQSVAKPALLRHLFGLATNFPAQILSYNKMLGQLQDAGNTTTLAHYVKLLETAFLLSGLEQYSFNHIRKRGSSPKLILWNNALVSAMGLRSFEEMLADPVWRGRLVENAVGARLLSELQGPDWSVSYWREGDFEVDFVVRNGLQTWALEVKSGRSGKQPGLARFKKQYPDAKTLLIGGEGIPLEEFFQSAPLATFKA